MVAQGETWTAFESLSFNVGAKFVAHGTGQLVGTSALEIRHAVMHPPSIVGDEAASAGFDAAFGFGIDLNPLAFLLLV
jgi:hypothetical protein